MVGEPDSAPPPARGLPQRPVIRGDRLRLRTLTLIRWVAAAGQTVTVLVVHFGLGFDLPVVFCLAVIAISYYQRAPYSATASVICPSWYTRKSTKRAARSGGRR